MTKTEAKPVAKIVNELFSRSPDGLRELVRAVMQEMLEAEMTDALGAEKGERSAARLGYRSGYYSRTLITRVGKLELRVPQDRDGRFSTELFERYQRSEQALVATLAEMYVQGVSTRKVKAITEELCGHSFSASAISAINKRLDESLEAFAGRPLEEPFPYLILDARYEKVREGGVVIEPGGADRHRHRLGRTPPDPGGRNGQPRKPFIVEGLPADRLAQTRPATASSWSSPTIMQACARPSARSCPKQPSSAATSTSCATPSITCRARPTTTACRSCAGSTTAARSKRPATTSPPGSPNGARVIRSSSHGSRKRSRRRSPSTGCRASIISISKAPTCWNASTRRSGDEPMCRRGDGGARPKPSCNGSGGPSRPGET